MKENRARQGRGEDGDGDGLAARAGAGDAEPVGRGDGEGGDADVHAGAPAVRVGEGVGRGGGPGHRDAASSRARGRRWWSRGCRWRRDETGRKPFTVYNLTVQGDHTYFAGHLDGGVWAHNDCHHSIPKFLGGDPAQPLTNISHQAHVELHRLLDWTLQANGMLGGRGGVGNSAADWAAYME